MKETDLGGEKWASVASQLVKAPTAGLPNWPRNTVSSLFCLVPSCRLFVPSANVQLLS